MGREWVMRRQLATGMAAACLFLGCAFAAEDGDTAGTERPVELETFVVSGEQPGPGLWKVSRGEHVLWVLAAYAPLPKGMTWRSRQMETRIAESQEVLYAGSANIMPNIGIFRALTLLPAALKATKIPDGRTLKDVMPPEDYAKWLALRLEYIGKDDDVERQRPAIALEQLRGAIFRKSGLQGGPNVYAIVGEARKKHKIARNALPAVSRTVRVENPKGILKSAQNIDLPDLDCFIRHLDLVEAQVERAREVANAWATGDIQKLRTLHPPRSLRESIRGEGCAFTLIDAFSEGDTKDAAHMKKTMADLEWHGEQASLQAQIDWVAAAQKSIGKNVSTFAVLPVADLFRPDGPLEKLRALGYTVEEPQ